MDENAISTGNFFVIGPDFDTWSGPDLQLFRDTPSVGSEEEILQSPGYRGVVQGEITFERVELDSLSTTSGLDIVGSGHLYRTKAIFTPDKNLSPNTEYTVYVSGDDDDTDAYLDGVSSRTVFDTVTDVGNLGTGEATFTGTYKGSAATDTFYVEITSSGDVGDSKFQYWRGSDVLSVFGPFKTKQSGTLLADGVIVSFAEGDYQLGDQWSVVVKARDVFLGNLVWPFKTGTGAIQELPTTTATSVLGDTVLPASNSEVGGAATFSVVSTDPADGDTNVVIDSGYNNILVTFSDTVDIGTIDSTTISLLAEPVNGDPAITASGVLVADFSASGSELTISILPGQLKVNNLVTVLIDGSVASTGATNLVTDYEFSYSTTYSPLYSTIRKVRLEYGSWITDAPDDTVNLAIFEASLAADQLTWNTDITNWDYYVFARSQWVTCKAAETLLINTTGGAGKLKSKKLGDLEVQYDTGGSSNDALARALNCMAKWELALQTGGSSVQGPAGVVKGACDPDRAHIGRGWYTRNDMPVGNVRYKDAGSRRYRTTYLQKKGRKLY